MIGEWFIAHRQSRWVTVITKTAHDFIDDRIPSVAAGVTFFVLLALFPGMGALAAIYSSLGDRGALVHELSGLAGLLPGGAMKVLAAELTRLAALKPEKIGSAFLVSLGIALWSASGGVTSLIEGLNIAFDVKERRSYIRVIATAVVFVVVLLVFGAIIAKLISLFSPVPGVINTSPKSSVPYLLLRWSSIFAVAVVFNALVYRYAPDRREPEARWLTTGSVTAAGLWVLGSTLFSWYVQNFGSYDRTYGALGAIVGFLTWIWLSLVALLLGAELDCALRTHK